MECITIYTDGSCLKNPGGPGGWAWFVSPEMWARGYCPETTNNRMELTAIKEAILAFKNVDVRLQIMTDSHVCLYNLMKIHPNRQYDKKATNVDIKKQIDEAYLSHSQEIDYGWCRGHSGLSGNEWADELAEEIARAGYECDIGPGINNLTESF